MFGEKIEDRRAITLHARSPGEGGREGGREEQQMARVPCSGENWIPNHSLASHRHYRYSTVYYYMYMYTVHIAPFTCTVRP